MILAGASLVGCAANDVVGVQSEAIIGGSQSPSGARPWQALILAPSITRCGGSLLTDSWVLTAGHCVVSVPVNAFSVVLGRYDRSGNMGEQVKSVDFVALHPQYGNMHLENDIALLHLSSPVDLTPDPPNPRVATIDLATGGDAPGVNAIMSGWGATSEGGPQPDVLMEATLPIHSNADCNAANPQRSLLDNELCAGFYDGSISACNGDSGGPLVVQRADNGWDLIGVVSRGVHSGACNSYTVFSRVTSHRAWITSMIGINTPADIMLRGDAAVAVTSQAGFDTTPPWTNTFSDVPVWHPQFGPIEAMWREGLTSGCANNGGVRAYCPGDVATRGHLATFLARAYGITQTDGGEAFSDVPSTHMFYSYIEQLWTAGLAVQCTGGPEGFRWFCPDVPVTRGDMANMFWAFTLAGRTPPNGWWINVTAGSYGTNAGAPPNNVTWHLAGTCNALMSCYYSVDFNVIGDPVPGIAKDYLAEWTCPPGSTVHRAWAKAEAGFGSVVRLACP
jgi:hypothetical protein